MNLAERVRAADPAALGQAITLVESRAPNDRERAAALLEALLPHTGGARRIGISGIPGVGKSTLIETLGCNLLERGERVAVLAVDPSSAVSGGSILGDKTRMQRLAQRAFVRPSPTGGGLGGVAGATYEAVLLCEAAGYTVVLVETVGVGQSESVVASLVDLLLLLVLPGAGDDLQGIKRGIVEMADLFCVNKADQVATAKRAQADLLIALRILRAQKPVLLCSAQTGSGVPELWDAIDAVWSAARDSGALQHKRADQREMWMWRLVEQRVLQVVREPWRALEWATAVRESEMLPAVAAEHILRGVLK